MSARRALRGCTRAALITLAACQSSKTAHDAAPDTPAAPAANVITVTTSDFHFDAPAETRAGPTTIRLVNQGPSPHHVQLIRLEQGKTADDLLAALKAQGPWPQWAILAGGPNPPEVGSSASTTVMLDAGNYIIVCFIPSADGVPHMMKGMVHPLTVTAATGPTPAEPTADLVVKLVDFDFQLSGPLTAGHHVLRVENSAGQPHEIAIIQLKPGKEPMDFAAWGEKQQGPAPGAMFGGVSGIMPGTHAYATVDLPPGEYALICFAPDVKDGKPHFVHGMAKKITVS
jgi:hypothetical protein